jgi:hypothetical protein
VKLSGSPTVVIVVVRAVVNSRCETAAPLVVAADVRLVGEALPQIV